MLSCPLNFSSREKSGGKSIGYVWIFFYEKKKLFKKNFYLQFGAVFIHFPYYQVSRNSD